MTVDQYLVDAVRRELSIVADPARAEGMKRYLKSELPCYGVRTPTLVSIPGEFKRVMREWSNDADLWRRRVSIIHQVGSKRATDLDLLVTCIEPSLDRSEFSLRKAIGWALLDFGWTDPDWVTSYVDAHEVQLSPLSRGEAPKTFTERLAITSVADSSQASTARFEGTLRRCPSQAAIGWPRPFWRACC